MPRAEHVISMMHEGGLPYYAVLLNEFQEYSVEEIQEYLRRWDLGERVRANRIAIASKDGAWQVARHSSKRARTGHQLKACVLPVRYCAMPAASWWF